MVQSFDLVSCSLFSSKYDIDLICTFEFTTSLLTYQFFVVNCNFAVCSMISKMSGEFRSLLDFFRIFVIEMSPRGYLMVIASVIAGKLTVRQIVNGNHVI